MRQTHLDLNLTIRIIVMVMGMGGDVETTMMMAKMTMIMTMIVMVMAKGEGLMWRCVSREDLLGSRISNTETQGHFMPMSITVLTQDLKIKRIVGNTHLKEKYQEQPWVRWCNCVREV